MQSSYARWWEGRIQWDKLSAASRSFARTIWLHVPDDKNTDAEPTAKIAAIRCIHTLAIALKHHLRGERSWADCGDLKILLAHIPNVCVTFSLLNCPADITPQVQLCSN